MISSSKSAVDYSSKYVLVVDDFPQQLKFMRQAMEAIGFQNIKLAQTPAAALAHCKEYRFDLIFCDHNMGAGKNGQQLLEEIRHFKLVESSCIFVMVTAETSRDIVLHAIESDPEGYIAKPFNEAVLRRKIDRLLDKQECLKDVFKAIENEEYPRAVEICHALAERYKRHHSWCLKTAAELHLKLGQYEHAERVYKDFLANRVLDWALVGLARTYIYRGNFKAAINELKQALVLNANCVPAHDLMADCYRQLDDSKSAEEELRKAVKISPLSVKRQDELGDICLVNADFKSADKAFRSSIKSAKHSIQETPNTYIKLAGAITDSMSGDLSRVDSEKAFEAQKVLTEVESRFDAETDTDVRRDLVNVRLLLNQQKPDKAMSLIAGIDQDSLMREGSLSDSAKFELAKTLLRLGDESKALQIFTEMLKNEELDICLQMEIHTLQEEAKSGKLGERANQLNEQGAKMYEEDQLERSIELFSEAARLSPKSVVVNLNLVQVLLRYMETEEVTRTHKKLSQDCLENIGVVDEENRHYARYSNLVQRIESLSTGPTVEH